MKLDRDIQSYINYVAKQFRSLAIIGPRQSGKTTLAKATFPNKPYVSLENLDQKLLAETDPRTFLGRYPLGAIVDEAQRVPELFNYLQEILDNTDEDSLFVLTGSNNFLLQDKISQSLAGRIGYVELLPLTISEIEQFNHAYSNSKNYDPTTSNLCLNGAYPEIYHKKRDHYTWYNSYIKTYIERDVRQLKNIENHQTFQRFLAISAGRIGQEINYQSMSVQIGIDQRTLKEWLSIAKASFILYELPPFHQNYNKRIVKSSKLYFYDLGIAAHLLDLKNESEIELSHFRGALLENLVINEVVKYKENRHQRINLYFWRDSNGTEVDLIIDAGNKQLPIEIKAGKTYKQDFQKNLKKYMNYSKTDKGLIIYDGEMEYTKPEDISLWNFRSIYKNLEEYLEK